MYPRYQVPMYSRMAPLYQQQYYRMPPMYGMMAGRPTGMRQSGGLLSRLFSHSNGTGASQGFNAYRGVASPSSSLGNGSWLKSLTNPASINQFLSGTQKVLNTAQQAAPLVQQYGPIVKNLPAMWKLYRGLKNAPDLSEEESIDDEKIVEPSSTDLETITNSPSPSKPKLYI